MCKKARESSRCMWFEKATGLHCHEELECASHAGGGQWQDIVEGLSRSSIC